MIERKIVDYVFVPWWDSISYLIKGYESKKFLNYGFNSVHTLMVKYEE